MTSRLYVFDTQQPILTDCEKIVVEVADDAEADDAGDTYPHAQTLGACRTEGGDGLFAVIDEHGFDNKQVVVERDDGVDQRY